MQPAERPAEQRGVVKGSEWRVQTVNAQHRFESREAGKVSRITSGSVPRTGLKKHVQKLGDSK